MISMKLSLRDVGRIPPFTTSVRKFIDDGDKGTDKGTDSAFHAEIGQDRCLIFDHPDDSLRAFPNTYATSRTFKDIDTWYHRLLLFNMGGSAIS